MESLAINDEVGAEAECIYTLRHMYELLSNRENEEARILMELPIKKENWRIACLKNDLEILRTRNPEDVEAKYKSKKLIIELLEGIDESVYEDMFGEGLVVVSRDRVEVEGYEHD